LENPNHSGDFGKSINEQQEFLMLYFQKLILELNCPFWYVFSISIHWLIG